MFSYIKGLFKKEVKDPRPKYRLTPDSFGKYTLDVWSGHHLGYTCVRVLLTEKQADKAIADLERETKYYVEEL